MKTKSPNIIKKNKNIVRIAVVVGLILMIPLFGDIFIQGWKWDIMDFISAAIILFGTGLIIDFAARKINNRVYRITAITAILLALFILWVEIATDGVSTAIQALF